MPAEPLGARLDVTGAHFAYPAPDAEAVLVCIFDAQDREIARHRLTGRDGDVHHGRIAGLEAGARYGLRVEGPWHWHRFNAQKLLVDPWAVRLDRPFALHPALFDTGDQPDTTDSAPHLPKAILSGPLPAAPGRAPAGPNVIYELHVKGFTQAHPDIPEAIRGTFAGLAHPATIAHLKALGVTTVELLPTAAWADERHLPPLGLSNYWGYNPAALLAPDPRLAPGGMAEIRAAVAALHAEGIAVIQDVVLNHTGEGDEFGPTLSLKGLGNRAFHRMIDDRRYANDAGCGNTLALDRPWPLRLAMDALRHWAEQAGLDGFRLDLATTLARRDNGFDRDAPLIQAMRQDPVLRDLWIIAEPWDIGHDGYRLGQFPPGWGEWNDRFRDDIRRFWRGDSSQVSTLATRLAGSTDAFPGRRLRDSVNYITAHDGFTLADLVSFTTKHNEANGEENRDGTGDNLSWNHGVEGPSEDPVIRAHRAGDARALLATLLLARGTPMLAMGDEVGRSQGGNNNAYAQDNFLSWFDWGSQDAALRDFTASLIKARLAHPALHDATPLTGLPAHRPDVAWRAPDGGAPDWHNPDSRALVAVFHCAEDRCLVALNAGDATLLALPPARPGFRWDCLANSAEPGTAPINLPARAVLLFAETALPRFRPEERRALEALAQAAGIATSWNPIAAAETTVPTETLRALLAAFDLPAENPAAIADSLHRISAARALPPSLSHRGPGRALLPLPLSDRALLLRITTEQGETFELPVAAGDGTTRRLLRPDGRTGAERLVALPELPPGRHILQAEDATCLLTLAPARCHVPEWLAAGQRRFGISAQIYGLRGTQDGGIGDFADIAAFARMAQAEGAAVIGLSPPHALFPGDRGRASPYHPSDRRFLDPIYLHFDGLEAPTRPDVDHAAVWAAKLQRLRAAWAEFPRQDPAFAAFRREGGGALDRFCAFTVLSERGAFPHSLRHGDAPAVAEFVTDNAEDIAFVAFQQFLADRQLAEAGAAGAGLYRDLAVGAAADGAEFWSGDMRFLPGFSIGAPPDPFSAQGQVWNLPPPDPRHAAATGHAGFARLIRANMRHAAALRVDHVLGLRRLFLVPDGAHAAEGTYLAQPFEDLLAQLALESHRAKCLVVGEDLGTLPEGIGPALQAADILSYKVLWFERQGARFTPPAQYPARAAACVSTHDLATLEGFWSGADLEERDSLGLLPEGARADREADRTALLEALTAEGLLPPDTTAESPMTDALAAAIHSLVAATPSALMLVQAEDLASETVAVNLPGTDRERPNWRRRLPVPVADLAGMPRAQAILSALRQAR